VSTVACYDDHEPSFRPRLLRKVAGRSAELLRRAAKDAFGAEGDGDGGRKMHRDYKGQGEGTSGVERGFNGRESEARRRGQRRGER
jgi:hypothetical protein